MKVQSLWCILSTNLRLVKKTAEKGQWKGEEELFLYEVSVALFLYLTIPLKKSCAHVTELTEISVSEDNTEPAEEEYSRCGGGFIVILL